MDDLGGSTYQGLGVFAQVTSSDPVLKDVSIDHVTAFPPRVLFILGAPVEARMGNFTFTNNLIGAGQFDIVPAGGGEKNCSYQPARQGSAGVLSSCFSNFNFSHNVIVGSKGGWPKGNSSPLDHAAAGVLHFSEGRYELCRDNHGDCRKTSMASRAGADGKDIGADVEAVFSATKGVE